MIRLAALLSLLALTACTSSPTVGAGIRISPSGVSVSPTVSGSIGDLGVTVSG
jgi:hypothetical protein